MIDSRHNTTTYTYDGFGQLWVRNSPDTGTTTYSYASDGQLQGYSRADGTLITTTYDALGRPTAITTGTQTRHMTYDSCTNGIGRICSASDATGTTSYTYDPQGDITRRQFTLGSTTYALGYSYDGSGRLATLTYPDGNQASYHYQYGRLSGITATVGGSTKTVASGLTYRGGDRQLASWTAGNGLTTTFNYDADGRLTGIHVPGVQSLDFTYDDADRIIDIINGVNPVITQKFTYDAMSRLTSIDSPSGQATYQYDANGNRTVKVNNGLVTTSPIATSSNRLASVGGQAIGYDANGNTISEGGVVKYHYDSFNRLVSAGGMTYYINPEGQRLRKSGTLGTTYFAPDRSGTLLAEHPDSGWVDYVWLGGRLVGRLTGGQVDAVHTDQVGRPEAVTNATGAVVWQSLNFPFVRAVSKEGITLNIGFPGQYYDAETGLWHNGYRDYAPTLGRYIESDPIGLKGGSNTYVYAAGNPITTSDPSGLCPKCQKPPQLPPGASVNANIKYMQSFYVQQLAFGNSHPMVTVLLRFYSLVKYGGSWDYKTKGRQYEDGGNFNYGAAGAAGGIPEQMLVKAAGVAQILHGSSNLSLMANNWGDDPLDTKQIKAGIAYYYCVIGGLWR